MFGKKKPEKIADPVDGKTGVGLLQKQIEQARRLLANRPVQLKDTQTWNNRTQQYLIRVYGERSPNVDTIVRASGEAPTWLFMPKDAAERYAASCLENKMQLLEGCVKALKLKGKEAQIS